MIDCIIIIISWIPPNTSQCRLQFRKPFQRFSHKIIHDTFHLSYISQEYLLLQNSILLIISTYLYSKSNTQNRWVSHHLVRLQNQLLTLLLCVPSLAAPLVFLAPASVLQASSPYHLCPLYRTFRVEALEIDDSLFFSIAGPSQDFFPRRDLQYRVVEPSRSLHTVVSHKYSLRLSFNPPSHPLYPSLFPYSSVLFLVPPVLP